MAFTCPTQLPKPICGYVVNETSREYAYGSFNDLENIVIPWLNTKGRWKGGDTLFYSKTLYDELADYNRISFEGFDLDHDKNVRHKPGDEFYEMMAELSMYG